MGHDDHTTEPEAEGKPGDLSSVRTAQLRRRARPAHEVPAGAPPPLGYSLEVAPDGAVLMITGGLDHDTAGDLRVAVDELKASPPDRLTIDLSDLQLLDAKGAGMLAALVKAVITEGGRSEIVGVKGQPATKLSRLAFERYVPVRRG